MRQLWLQQWEFRLEAAGRYLEEAPLARLSLEDKITQVFHKLNSFLDLEDARNSAFRITWTGMVR